jgi:hypothetical protein
MFSRATGGPNEGGAAGRLLQPSPPASWGLNQRRSRSFISGQRSRWRSTRSGNTVTSQGTDDPVRSRFS